MDCRTVQTGRLPRIALCQYAADFEGVPAISVVPLMSRKEVRLGICHPGRMNDRPEDYLSIALDLRELARNPGRLVHRAKLIILAEQFEQIASDCRTDRTERLRSVAKMLKSAAARTSTAA